MLTWLYVPGDRPDRFGKAVDSGADVVILDLEDAVHPSRKAYARAAVAEFLPTPHAVPLQVRINDLADAEALAGFDVAFRLPKTEVPSFVVRVAERAPGHALHCLIESALGVENAYAIATAHPAVASIGLGEADLRSDLGVAEPGLLFARSRIVLAARAAELVAPAMSVYPDIHDLAGLAASSRAGASLGLLGRAAIHPVQLPVIVDAFRPSEEESREASELLEALAAAAAVGSATAVLPDGRFADAAMVRAAQRTVALSHRYGRR